MKLLFIDDEEELVSTLTERLEFRGIDADWTTKPDEALRLIAENSYDIAVVDIKMPGISGFELKKKMEKIRPELCYIFLTGHASENNYMQGCDEAGEKYYLVKPVNLEYLIDLAKQLMNEKEQRN